MNIHRFILPGSIAAAFHAALLLVVPNSPLPGGTTVVEVPLGPPPHPPVVDETPPRPRDDSEESQVVKALPHGEPPPVIPEELLPAKQEAQVAIPVEPAAPTRAHSNKLGPPGDPEAIGHGPWTGPTTPFIPGDQLDRIPNAKVQVAPDYPAALQQEGVGGTVLVECNVDAGGRVVGARVVQSTRREFEAPTLRAVQKWRFEPGRKNGRPVPFRLIVPVNFQMTER